jgi:hypothetical protein
MKPQVVKRRLVDGTIKTYSYEQISRNLNATEIARRLLEQRPLFRIRSKKLTVSKSVGYRWSPTGTKRKPIFNHATIKPLLDSGWAICAGDIIEKKGAVR